MNDPKVKQQIGQKIRDASNILVTVSRDPSVDELSAALGLTLLLNKMDKHATAIFSGQTPPAITFLEPDKTFEGTTNSLRDFIIALDKEKADHLRYKLEGDLVKIYITPYRTTITDEDLEFSQGDYNVELVIALGVEDKDHLDAALDGHGKILHDATVVTLTAGDQVSNLGTLDWHDSNASSLSEMLTSLQDSMKLDKKLMDKSIATAFLTGIVSATERFSNPRTSSRVMTVAASLMAAGADQQLIAARLEEAEEEPKDTGPDEPLSGGMLPKDDEVVLAEGKKTKVKKEEPPKKNNGELVINHQKEGTLEEVAEATNRERLEESARAAQRALEKQEEVASAASMADAPEDQEAQPPELPAKPVESVELIPQPDAPSEEGPEEPVAPTPKAPAIPPVPAGAVDFTPGGSAAESTQTEPLLGGTLNATSEQAEEDKRREIEKDKNKVILSHNHKGTNQQPTYDTPMNSASAASKDEAPLDIFGDTSPDASTSFVPQTAPTFEASAITPPSEQSMSTPAPVTSVPPPPQLPTLADIDAQNRSFQPQAPADTSHEEARAAIDAAFAAAPATSELPPSPVAMEAPIAPPLPDLGDIGLPLPPPLPADFGAPIGPLPPSTDQPLGDILPPQPAAPVASPQPAAPSDPGQFRIPGQ